MLYRRKIIDELEHYLDTDEIVVLHGARQVGKTHILYFLKQSLEKRGAQTHYIDLEDSRFVAILDAGVESFLGYLEEEGVLDRARTDSKEKVYVFIDEIQYLKDPSPFLKLLSDHHRYIKLIVSGSSSFAIKSKFSDSLVGRTVNFEVFPLSFQEFLVFRSYRFQQREKYSEKKREELRELFAEYTLFGGYPKIVLTREREKKERYLQQIIDTYVRKDIRDLAEIRDIEKFNKLLEVLAAQSGNLLNIAELAGTCHLASQTIERYLFILENTYILKLVRPWSGNIRSELFKTPKVFFYDTGLMQMLWLKKLQKEIIGNVFETSIFSELVKKYGRESVFYWRTKQKKEIDFIVRTAGQSIPLEAKLNAAQFDPASLRYFQENYALSAGGVVALRGDRRDGMLIHPWDV